MKSVFLSLFLFASLAPAQNNCVSAVVNGNACSSATWSNCGGGVPAFGDTVVVALHFPVDVPAGCMLTSGTSPASTGAPALTTNDAITFEAGSALWLQGPWAMGAAPITFNGGATWIWDTANAADPLDTNYAATCSGGGKRVLTVAGNSVSHVTIYSNLAGGNGTINPSGSSCLEINEHFVDYLAVGDSVRPASFVTSGTDNYINRITDATFDRNSGGVYFGASTALGGWDLERIRFSQVNPALDSGSGTRPPLMNGVAVNAASTATRKLYQLSFAPGTPSNVKPYFSDSGSDIQDPFLPNGWNDNRFARSYPYANWNGGYVRLTKVGGTSQTYGGSISNLFFAFGSNAAPVYTGTLTGADATHFTDTNQAWVKNQFSNGDVLFQIEIVAGTGTGQRRAISANTTNTATIPLAWTVVPDSTSAYEITQGSFNPHGLEPGVTGTPVNLTGIVWENYDTDSQGDCNLHMDAPTGKPPVKTYSISFNIVLPNAMGDNTCTILTNFGLAPQNFQNVFHSTAFGGAQSPVSVTEGGAGTADSIARVDSNIFWRIPGVTYWGHGGDGGGFKITAGASGKPISQTTLDVVAPGVADYNSGYGLRTDGYNGGGSYNYNFSVTPGQHDLDGNPVFVGCPNYGLTVPVYAGSDSNAAALNYCNFPTWATGPDCGSTSVTIKGQIADGEWCLFNNPALARTSLLPFIFAGYETQNAMLFDAAPDGTTIGAAPYQAP